jgi:hypothetical protein
VNYLKIKMGNKAQSLDVDVEVHEQDASVIWQWQSNRNPWNKEEEEEWTSYNDTTNSLIEKNH